jgi:hypothetical protein
VPESVAPTTRACIVYLDLPCWCELILPIMRSLSGLNFAADFVEEIEDEADLAHRSSLS